MSGLTYWSTQRIIYSVYLRVKALVYLIRITTGKAVRSVVQRKAGTGEARQAES